MLVIFDVYFLLCRTVVPGLAGLQDPSSIPGNKGDNQEKKLNIKHYLKRQSTREPKHKSMMDHSTEYLLEPN
jgi:hypothetical protein